MSPRVITLGRRILLLIAATIAVGCVEDQAEVSREQQQLRKSTGFEEDRPAIGVLRSGLWPFCSATLIHPQVVLTAGHCADEGGKVGFSPGLDGAADYDSGRLVQGQIVLHPDYSNGWLPENDLALVLLDEPIEDVPPIPAAFFKAKDGWKLQAVGYGCTDDDGNSDWLRRIGKVKISSVYDSILGLDNDDARLCPGDSGGPALRVKNGVEYVVGVNSYENTFWNADRLARVDTSFDWVEDHLMLFDEIPADALEISSVPSTGGCSASSERPASLWSPLLLLLLLLWGRTTTLWQS